jgi:hypothetical protein
MDPSNTCGDDPSATTKDYRVLTSTDGNTFQLAKQDSFTLEDRSRLNLVPLDQNDTGVVKVRLVLLSPQSDGPGDSGADFIDFSELEVFGGPPNALPSGSLQATPDRVSLGAPVSFDASSFTDPDSLITGYEWDFDSDGIVDQTTDGPATEYTYPDDGEFTAAVAVNDFRGGAGSATANVTVKPGPTVHIPDQGKNGKIKLQVSCGSTPCDLSGKLKVTRNVARRLGFQRQRIARFEGTVGEESATFKLEVPRKVRKAARKDGIDDLTVRVAAQISDAAGLSSKAKHGVDVRI